MERHADGAHHLTAAHNPRQGQHHRKGVQQLRHSRAEHKRPHPLCCQARKRHCHVGQRRTATGQKPDFSHRQIRLPHHHRQLRMGSEIIAIATSHKGVSECPKHPGEKHGCVSEFKILTHSYYFIKNNSTAKHLLHNRYNLKHWIQPYKPINPHDKIVLFFHIIILQIVNQFPLTLQTRKPPDSANLYNQILPNSLQ